MLRIVYFAVDCTPVGLITAFLQLNSIKGRASRFFQPEQITHKASGSPQAKAILEVDIVMPEYFGEGKCDPFLVLLHLFHIA